MATNDSTSPSMGRQIIDTGLGPVDYARVGSGCPVVVGSAGVLSWSGSGPIARLADHLEN